MPSRTRSGRKGQMIRQGQIDMVHQLHIELFNGIINHRLGQLKEDAVCLCRQTDDIPGDLLVLENKDLFNLTFLKLISYGLVKADSLSHENRLLARVVQRKHQRIVQHLNDTHGITDSPRLS